MLQKRVPWKNVKLSLAKRWGIFRKLAKTGVFQREFFGSVHIFKIFFLNFLWKNAVIFEISFGKFIHWFSLVQYFNDLDSIRTRLSFSRDKWKCSYVEDNYNFSSWRVRVNNMVLSAQHRRSWSDHTCKDGILWNFMKFFYHFEKRKEKYESLFLHFGYLRRDKLFKINGCGCEYVFDF